MLTGFETWSSIFNSSSNKSEGTKEEELKTPEISEILQNKSDKSKNVQMNKSPYILQIINSSFDIIYSNKSSEGEIINNFNEGISLNYKKSPSLYTQLTEEQRIQKLETIISEINQEGIYLGELNMSL